jgi:signal transduction histidine kinase
MIATSSTSSELAAHDAVAEFVHDLCTPLVSVSTAVDALLERIDSIDRREASELLHRARDGTRWLQELVEQMAEVPAMTPEPMWRPALFNISSCAERSASIAKPLLRPRKQRVALQLPRRPLMVWGDERLIRRVVLNLLANAAKYGATGDTIHLAVTTRPRHVLVEVLDHGRGVSSADAQRIFGPYVRAEAPEDDAASGQGLGLSIVKSLVELHGGNVGVRSSTHRGTAFWFSLPWAPRSGRR